MYIALTGAGSEGQTSMSIWCFRLGFRMATGVSDGRQVQVRIGGIAHPIELEPETTGTLEQADWFVCTSCGYASEQEARENGERLRTAFLLAGARNRLGVDCGFDRYTFRLGEALERPLRDVLAKNMLGCFGPSAGSHRRRWECGINRVYLSSVERGERNVSIDNIARIAKGLQVAPWKLLKDD
jgi:hypothetical protein